MARMIHTESYLGTESKGLYLPHHLHQFPCLFMPFAYAMVFPPFCKASLCSAERNTTPHSKQAIPTHQQQTHKEEYVSALTILMSSKGLPLSFITRVRSMSFTTL